MDTNMASALAHGPRVASARSLVEAAHDTIRHEILTGSLAPETKLRFEMLRKRYGFGASTLREALTRLVGEALVTSEEQKGFRVAPVSLEDLADLTRTRIFVEKEALRESILAGDDAWEGRVVAAYHRLSKIEAKLAQGPEYQQDEFEERNREFHQALISACPSRWLNHLYGILFQQSERYRRISLVNRVVSRDVHGEHKAIFEAALARDADLACKVAGEHIERTLAIMAKVLAG
ncbi:FCD domain-containing protein [Acidocella aromatica]|uniref:DNA-binding GntR family transcriptional regulator n=1 Tax=Acidocella aromatica TaxID=1303579 RepID=A0A840VMD3_9PROT|nr:FCD domain-containing protein [Acidocella aromatica]MBB5374285.1 DNA-binding GntR family transcriptional regulator [Acidocella aromatica]